MTTPRRPTFRVDTTVCTGCKACLVACRDRNDLPTGVEWRRVYEVAGGDWHRQGASAWWPDIFAWNISLSCNHCDEPICVEGCPSGALSRRGDGLVLLDETICLGCGYCGWSCPYGAPQLRPDTGAMSKCSFCVEDLDAGRAPACVAACPMRVLECIDGRATDEMPDIEPLPDAALTSPALVLDSHPDASRAAGRDIELEPRPPRSLREWSLVAFTLLIQMAAGLAVGLGVARWSLLRGGDEAMASALDRIGLPLVPLLTIVAMAVSLLHLGQPKNMLRAMTGLRTSWLSREILLANAFLGSGVVALTPYGAIVRDWLLPVAGLALIGGMARVYMLRTVPIWNRVSTPLRFFTAGLALGGLLTVALLATLHWGSDGAALWFAWAGALALAIRRRGRFYGSYRRPGL